MTARPTPLPHGLAGAARRRRASAPPSAPGSRRRRRRAPPRPPSPAAAGRSRSTRARSPRGSRSTGPTSPGSSPRRPDQATFLALDSIAPNRAELFEALQALSTEARLLTQGDTVGVTEVDDPPPDSGHPRADRQPRLAHGHDRVRRSLFDGRYGLAARAAAAADRDAGVRQRRARPAAHRRRRARADLRRPARHGRAHGARAAARGRRAAGRPVDDRRVPVGPARAHRPQNNRRNLFAFRDGTANPDVTDAGADEPADLGPARHGEPAWTAGGTYMVVRTIRMHVEFWDRVGMLEQEQMIGRDRVTGAPLGGTDEFEDPRYDLDPQGQPDPAERPHPPGQPPDARDRRPADPAPRLQLPPGRRRGRRPRPGPVFVAFNQDPARQFATIQRRLDDEPMIDYITPVGGGYFFAPRGTRGGRTGSGRGWRRSDRPGFRGQPRAGGDLRTQSRPNSSNNSITNCLQIDTP